LPTYLSNSEPIPEFVTVRLIVEALKLSKNNAPITLNKIAESAGTTLSFAKRVLGDQISTSDGQPKIVDSSTRFKLSIRAVRLGALLRVTRALTWQEFESFSEECLQTVGFHTQKGVVVKDHLRRWQIDIIARKGRMILAVDCKHWESPGYNSKLSKASKHQKLALLALLRKESGEREFGDEQVLALPIVLTLFEPRYRIIEETVVVSVEQFADFLEGLSPYSSEMPFVLAQDVAKSSMSQSIDGRAD
jgi:Holliday junction resolvase-like predicted endonuclease